MNTDILIVGAGPVGLSLGAEFLRAGVDFQIVERRAGQAQYSQASVVHVRIQELFDIVGVIDRIKTHGHWMRPQRTVLFGNVLGDMVSTGVDDTPYPGPWIVGQNKVEQALLNHLEAHGKSILRPAELIESTQTNDHVTSVIRYADGREETITSKWIIGADGVRSTVRSLYGIEFEGKQYNDDFEFMIADVQLPPSFPGDHGWTMIHPDGAILLLFPQEGTYRIVFSRPRTGAPATGAPSLEEFQAIVDRYGPPGARLSNPTWLTRYGCECRVAEHLRLGRVFLAGDAAHQHVPLGGQGMNTGVQDAFNLAWKLALMVKGLAPDSLLDSYEMERKPVAKMLTATTDRLVSIGWRPSLALRFWTATGGKFAFRNPIIRRRIRDTLGQMNINYRNSPAVSDRATGKRRPLAGDRIRDGVLLAREDEHQLRVFDLVREPRTTILLFTGVSQRRETVVAACAEFMRATAGWEAQSKAAVVYSDGLNPDRAWTGPAYRDLDGRLHKLYGITDPTVIVLRPDTYIGYVGPVSELSGYLGRIFQTPDELSAAPIPARAVAS